jgi:hypothetical protein
MTRCLALLGLAALAIGAVALTQYVSKPEPPAPTTETPSSEKKQPRLTLLAAPVFHARFSLN